MRHRACLILLCLLGCASGTPDPREVTRPLPPEGPSVRRFELVEVATLGTRTGPCELFVPLASTDEGVQRVETMRACIAPDTSYTIGLDANGNRILKARAGAGALEVRVTYVVTRIGRPAADLNRLEDRELTFQERGLFALELGRPRDPDDPPWPRPSWSFLKGEALGPDIGSGVEKLRAQGVPARAVAGFALEEGVTAVEWLEAWVPGLSWTSFYRAPGELPASVLVVSRGGASPLPWAVAGGRTEELEVTFSRRDL